MAIFLLSGVNLVDIVMTNLCFPLSIVVGAYIALNKPLDREAVFLIIFTSIVMFLLTMSFSFLVHYVSALNKRILTVTQSNLSLLNSMHEGLLIASPGDDRNPI